MADRILTNIRQVLRANPKPIIRELRRQGFTVGRRSRQVSLATKQAVKQHLDSLPDSAKVQDRFNAKDIATALNDAFTPVEVGRALFDIASKDGNLQFRTVGNRAIYNKIGPLDQSKEARSFLATEGLRGGRRVTPEESDPTP